MKIMVFSDSHGSAVNMERVLELHSPDTDAVLHLGDGKREFEAMMQSYPNISHMSVDGNYEDVFSASKNTSAAVELGGIRIFLTHGHRYNVKYGIDSLVYAAAERDCDIALYGHTHRQMSEYIPSSDTGRPMWIFNPGSIRLPRDSRSPKFGIIQIIKGQILISPAELD